ncbi:unnamed protein product, partial [Discosporangium mesarthrocarpum]
SRILKRLKKTGANDAENEGSSVVDVSSNSRDEEDKEGERERERCRDKDGERDTSRTKNGDRNGSYKRERSRRSPSPSDPSPNNYAELEATWGTEKWQDFELLRNSVPGPSTAAGAGGVGGPGSGIGVSAPGASPRQQGGAPGVGGARPLRHTSGGGRSGRLGGNQVSRLSSPRAGGVPDFSGENSDVEENLCGCTPRGLDAPTCYDDACVNFATMQECPRGQCHRTCQNQRIQRGQEAKVEVFEAEGKGWGLKVMEAVAKGRFIIEYVGEIITRKELDKRMLSSAGLRKLYMMQLGDHTYLDAKRKGGLARFVNHSCEPTCRLEQWHAGGCRRCAVFALKDIAPGEELSFDYQWEAHHLRPKTKCLCGSPSCRGTLEIEGTGNEETEGQAGPMARRPGAGMGVWRTPLDSEYADPVGLVGRRVRIYYDGDCHYYSGKV